MVENGKQSQKHCIDLITTKTCSLKLTYYEDNQRKQDIIKYPWYFIISKNDRFELEVKTTFFNTRFKDENDKWTRVYCDYPKRKDIIAIAKSNDIQTYEADLSLVRRYWIDSNLHVADLTYFRILYIDIEVDDTVSGLRIGEDTIISFAAVDNKGKKYIIIESERDLLLKVKNILERYDIIIGWNSRNYDIPYLKARFEKYNIEFPDICHIDMMQRMIHAYRFDTAIKSFALDNIAYQFLGKRKVQRTTKVIEIFNNDFEKFKKYNLTDATLLKDLNDKYHIIDMILKQSYWCNVTPRSLGQGGHGMYTLIDSLILREMHNRGLKGLSPKYTFDELVEMPDEELKKLDYPGGLVLTPKPGIYKNVYIFDFKTLYPSIILTSNIGFESLDKNGDIRNPSGARFNSKPPSVLVEVLNNLLTKREEYKKEKLDLIEKGMKGTPDYEAAEANEAVVKELGNSVYGIMGAKWGRYFVNREIVESITLMGQYLLKTLEKFFEQESHLVITGDTDSVIIETKSQININDILDRYHSYLKKRLETECGIGRSQIELAFDRYFKKFIIVAKKNYAGHLTNQEGRNVDYIHIRGLEAIKSDTCKVSSNILKELIDLILKTDNTTAYYINWLENKRKTIFENINPSDLIIRKKIKKLEQYKNPSLAVLIAQKKIKKGDVLVHHEVGYIVTGREKIKIDNKMRNRLTGVELEDFKGHFDKEYYWNKMILSQCSRLLKVAFPNVEWDTKTYYDIFQKTLFI